jgi:hypothetical protein
MSDFIREVDEEYRRDRVVNFLAKNQIALIGQGVEAQAAFDKIQADGPAGYAMLARMKAVQVLATRDSAAAAKGFDAIAGDDSVDPVLRDAALFRGALIRVDSDDPKDFELRYAAYAKDGFAFHASLRELLALAAFKRNDTEAAGRWLDQIVVDPNAPTAVRSRAEAFLGLVAAGPAVVGTPELPKPVLETATPKAAPMTPTPTTVPPLVAPATPAASGTAPAE